MQTREEITALVDVINQGSFGTRIRLRDEEYTELETLLHAHPEIWPVGVADTFAILLKKLQWECVDRQAIPEPLLDFFDDKFTRDLDPMALARSIGREISAGCAECECKC